MAYMRGDLYVWRDSAQRLHIWSRNGADDISDMEGYAGEPNAAGLILGAEESDALALMIVAELVRMGQLAAAVEHSLRNHCGNFGAAALEELGLKLVAACRSLGPDA